MYVIYDKYIADDNYLSRSIQSPNSLSHKAGKNDKICHFLGKMI